MPPESSHQDDYGRLFTCAFLGILACALLPPFLALPFWPDGSLRLALYYLLGAALCRGRFEELRARARLGILLLYKRGLIKTPLEAQQQLRLIPKTVYFWMAIWPIVLCTLWHAPQFQPLAAKPRGSYRETCQDLATELFIHVATSMRARST